MKHNFKKAQDDIRAVKLSAAEKSTMLARIVATPFNAPVGAARPVLGAPVRSWWTSNSFVAWIGQNRTMSSVMAAFLILVIAGGGITYAAKGALPGGGLYGVKTQIVEPLKVAFAPTAADKAAVQVQIADTRLTEAETLAADGELTAPKQQQISNLLQQQVTDLSGTLAQVRKQSESKADDISVDFKASMNAHAHVLDTLAAGEAPETKAAPAAAPAISATSATSEASTSVTVIQASSTTPAGEDASLAGTARAAAARIDASSTLLQSRTSADEADILQKINSRSKHGGRHGGRD